MKSKVIYAPFAIALFISGGCESPDPLRQERHILKTHVLDPIKKESTFLVEGEHPLPIPNTNRILYKNHDNLYTIALDGSARKFISSAPGAASTFAFNGRVSPDGQKFAFEGNEKKYLRTDIFIVNIMDGVGYTNLTKSLHKAEYLAGFDPTSRKLTFQETIYDESGKSVAARISMMDIDGENYQTVWSEGGGAFLQFTSDGERIIFFRYDTRLPGTDLYVLRLDNRELNVIRIGTEIPSPTPVITSDGKLLYVGDQTDVYRMDLVTFQKEKLYSGLVGELFRFSNDHTKAAYFSRGIHVLDLINGRDVLVSEVMDASLWYLEFSQDDQRIIYTTHEVEIFYK